jgi:hypothetical protein
LVPKEDPMKRGPRSALVVFLSAVSCSCLLLCILPATSAAEYRLDSDTLLRVFERDTSTDTDQSVVPAYHYLQLDLGRLESEGLSFHFYGWGRVDLADSDFYADQTAGEILYGYAQYTDPISNLNLRVGRQYLFSGITNESLDGIRVDTDLGRHFAASVYGGQPAALDGIDGRDGDHLWGARISHQLTFHGLHDLGLSYKQLNNDDVREEEKLGIDLSLGLPHGITVDGLSARNLTTGGWAEHSYEAQLRVADLHLRPYAYRFRYEDFFAPGRNSANPFRYLTGFDETLNVIGTDAIWRRYEAWDIGAKVKNHDYDKRDGSAQYISGLATWHGEGLSQAGGELGYMNGDDDRDQYLVTRGFIYWDRPLPPLASGFMTGDLVVVNYDREILDEDNSFFISFGLGGRFYDDALELRFSGDYSSDPYFDDDLRGLVVAKYTWAR